MTTATAKPRVKLLDRSLYTQLIREKGALTIDKDLHTDVRAGLHMLATMVGVAEGVSPEARDKAATVFFAVRKLARNAEGEKREWPWCLKGVDAVSHTGEIIASFPRDGEWLRPTEALELGAGDDYFFVFHPKTETPAATPAPAPKTDDNMPF